MIYTRSLYVHCTFTVRSLYVHCAFAMEMYAAPAFRVLQAAAVAFVAILANAVAMSVAQAVALHRRLRGKQAAPAAYVLHAAAYQAVVTTDVSVAKSEFSLPNYSPNGPVRRILLVVFFLAHMHASERHGACVTSCSPLHP